MNIEIISIDEFAIPERSMTREEAIEILQELWRYKETDKYTEAEIRQALEMAVKALEETGIKPPCGVKELLAERKRTNQQMLATITAEEFYDKIIWLFHDYGKRYTNSRLSIIEWLDSEVEE